MMRRFLLKILTLSLVLVVPAVSFSQIYALSEKEIMVKVFQIKFKDIDDAAALVTPLLSDFGTLTIQPKLKTITVQDFEGNLKKIEEAIRGYDLPPKNVEIIINLIMATEKEGGGTESISREIRGVSEALSDFTRWTNYSRIGSVIMTSMEGSEAASSIGEQYHVSFLVEYASEERGIIKFSRFSLEKLTGKGNERKLEPLWNTALSLLNGKLLVVGAAKQPGSKRALFLTIQANIK
ncbi:MAG: hypothetical protein AB1756_00380 [Acidobacteriota bacterium]